LLSLRTSSSKKRLPPILARKETTLKDAGAKAAQKTMQEGLSKLMTAAGTKIGELLLLWLKL
jgi:hypothetical protein